MDILTLSSDEGEAVVFAVVGAEDFSSVVDGIIEMSWSGFAGTEGFHDQTIAEIWRDDLGDNVQADGSLSISLGRWHTFPAAEVRRFSAWVDALLEGRPTTKPGARLRPSTLAV